MKVFNLPAKLLLSLTLLQFPSMAQTPVSDTKPHIRITAGSETTFTDSQGFTWEGARGFSGGEVVTRPLPKLREIYRSERYGNFSFSEVLQNGKYRVSLHFCETYHQNWDQARGKRSFTVQIENSRNQIKDLSREAGGLAKPLVKVYEVTVRDGKLDISFQATPLNKADYDPPCLNAIEIEWLSKQTGLKQRGEKTDQVELYKD